MGFLRNDAFDEKGLRRNVVVPYFIITRCTTSTCDAVGLDEIFRARFWLPGGSNIKILKVKLLIYCLDLTN